MYLVCGEFYTIPGNIIIDCINFTDPCIKKGSKNFFQWSCGGIITSCYPKLRQTLSVKYPINMKNKVQKDTRFIYYFFLLFVLI